MGNSYIGYLYDKLSNKFKLPVTSTKAVIGKNGKNLDQLLEEIQPKVITLIIKTSSGLTLSSGVNTLSVRVIRDDIDITDDCDEQDFTWTREEPNWLRQQETGKSIVIGSADLVSEKATFLCQFKKYKTTDIVYEASESITLDETFSDNINLVGWIDSNLPHFVKETNNELLPDWSSKNLILTPVLKKPNNEDNLTFSRLKSKKWYRRTTSNYSWTRVTSGSNGEYVDSRKGILTVSQNKLTGIDETVEYRFECIYYDTETNKTLNYEMQISFVKIVNGINGKDGENGSNGENGSDGKDGIGIKSISQTKKSTDDNGINELTIIKTDNTVNKFYVENGSKGSAGIDGKNGWTRSIIHLYRRSSRALTRNDLNFGTLTYDVSTNSIIEAHNNQVGSWWTTTIAGSNSLYETFAIVHTQENQVVLNVSDWSYPVILSEQGSSGQEGQTVAFVTLYQRAEDTPEKPYNNVVFNFISHSISETKDASGEILPWSLNVPENNASTLWCISAIASGRGESDVISSSEWCDPIRLVKNGTDGINGRDGINGIDGKDGINGIDGINGVDGKDGIDGADGKDGKSAYELAVERGYEGTEEEWLLELHTELRFQYTIIAGEYDYIRSYGPNSDEAYGYIDGVAYGVHTTWTEEAPLNVPDGSYVWIRAKNTYTDVWQYARLTGKTGASAGFGNIIASVDTGTGIPSVEIEESGTNIAKNIYFKFKNLRGKEISSIQYKYAVTTVQNQPDLDEIDLEEIPILDSINKYLWKKTIITYSDGTKQTDVALMCVYGDTGPIGLSTTIRSIEYGVSNSSSLKPENWQTLIPNVSSGNYLWTKITYSDESISYSYSYQPISSDTFYIKKQYGLSTDESTEPEEWKDSIVEDWYHGLYIWCRDIKKYDNGQTYVSQGYYNQELTYEFIQRNVFSINVQNTYISNGSTSINRLLLDINSGKHKGVLTLSTSIGEFVNYDDDTNSWISLSNTLVINLDTDDLLKNYGVAILMNNNSICNITVQFSNWNNNVIEDTKMIVPIIFR